VRFVRGFAANFFFFLFVTLIASLASLEQSNSFQNEVELALLQSQLVEQRFYDSLDYFNASFRDAVIDSAHQSKCDGVAMGDFCAVLEENLADYAYDASLAMQYNGVNASLDGLGLDCGPAFALVYPPYETAFAVKRNATLIVSAGNVSQLAFVEFSTTLFLNTSSQNPDGSQNFWVLFDDGGKWEYERYPGSC